MHRRGIVGDEDVPQCNEADLRAYAQGWKMPRSGVKRLFEDVDARSTASIRSEKGKKLEAAMLRAKELRAKIDKEKEEKAQKEQKREEKADKEEEKKL